MIDVQQITELHRHATTLWHQQEIDNPYSDLLRLVCEQHRYNYLLWHEEDIARSPDVGDQRVAAVKRAIDKYNQQRNDAIEQVDDYLKRQLESRGIAALPGAKWNTETPGQAIDRLSILALRIYHMQEQLERADVDAEHRSKVRGKLEILDTQHADLCAALAELLADIFAGRKQLKLYRQFKMYNDPTLNPYLYQSGMRKAG